ncbi:MAG: cellulase family glycosylhydrolase, partial [Alphaproteobacteria bacterium]|nr:cellulase family glycosylhydrolase [Alphaproteobacteria bacterium]
MIFNLIRCAWLILLTLSLANHAHASRLHETTFPQNTGVNIHFVNQDLDSHIALLKEAGFGWVRKDLSWGAIETQKGTYDFTKYDPLIDALNDAGISVVLILDYSNPLYDDNLSPYTYEGRKAFANFAGAAAKHFANKKVIWEIYNEPNWLFWKPVPHVENYLALARVVTHKLRQIAP